MLIEAERRAQAPSENPSASPAVTVQSVAVSLAVISASEKTIKEPYL